MFSWIRYRFFLSLVFAFLAVFVLRTFFFEPFRVASRSMIPTLLGGDYVLVNKYSYGYSHASPFLLPLPIKGRWWSRLPERDDVIVFKSPLDGTNYVKRVIGLPGDTIVIKDDALLINDEKASLEPFAITHEKRRYWINKILGSVNYNVQQETLPSNREKSSRSHLIIDIKNRQSNMPLYVVPDEHLFVMGDNRDMSLDSRSFRVGPIPIENIVGRVEAVLLSFSEETSLLLVPFLPSSWRFWNCCHRVF